jgi:hypothetical protein
MTMPASNINLITDVRNVFMQDSSGNASLNSARYRDGAGKGSGNVRLTDFANRAWSQGREEQEEGSPSTVKPYMNHQGVDGWSFDRSVFDTSIVNGLPRWRMKESWTNMMTNISAFYSNTWFYCKRPGVQHTFYCDNIISKWHNGYGSYVGYEFSARGWDNGYQSGTQQIWQDWNNVRSSSGSRSFTFTPTSSHRYVQIALRIISRGYQGWDGEVPNIDITAYNMRVTA